MLSLAHYHCHRFLAEQGRRWAERGYIEAPGDIFLLTLDQVLAAFRLSPRAEPSGERLQANALEGKFSSEEARTQVRRYKRMRACYRNFEPPLTIGWGIRAGVPKVREAARQAFEGVACSAGKATARAKVVRDLSEARKLRKGEILVAPYSNPGWVPLFNLAAGIVMEEGGLISHGAIVAREYGIPAVLQIRDATKVFRDGQVLCVDGERGVVEVIEG